ncbi:glycosyltransferase [Bacillus sp. OK048]|uniref:glycosyltransferase n=1 Tax=Bacillus sp. OK048 TaxID=1882761 RepID=UPI00088EB64C|nr:glycosyltransferase [Bacillus sp. OK048]SDM78232.1 Glycosyltransferase involved in cell wall bisynthesis [Bacillus sp. OK048]
MKPLVSIIVPIFKVENYLRKCIDSLLNQTLLSIEVILVNDGCPNGCGNIIEEYKKRDTRVITIHKKNGGQSSARNAGLDIARGEFIGFIDPDDWIEPNMYEALYKSIISSNADVAICGRGTYEENGNVGSPIIPEQILIDFSSYPKFQYVIQKFFFPHTASTCNKLYRREILYKYNLRFKDVSYVGSEDALFNYAVLCNAKKIVAISDVLYNVLIRNDSTVRTFNEGYMIRTSNLIKSMHEYSGEFDTLDLYRDSYPIIFLYYQQWNIDRVNMLTNNNIQIITNELKQASKLDYFNKSSLRVALDYKMTNHMKKIGYSSKGILFIRIFMLLSSFKLYNLASRFRSMRRLKPN